MHSVTSIYQMQKMEPNHTLIELAKGEGNENYATFRP